MTQRAHARWTATLRARWRENKQARAEVLGNMDISLPGHSVVRTDLGVSELLVVLHLQMSVVIIFD